MAVNLLVDVAEPRFGDVVRVPRGYELVRATPADDRLAAWIDWQFAPSWWSSEVRSGEAWVALDDRGDIAGFAAFDARGLHFPWMRAYRDRTEVGIFGPYGVAAAHRGTGVGAALLAAALRSLHETGYAHALIPAVAPDALAAMYRARTGARIVDEFSYASPRRFRTTILASGGGTNAQNVFDGVADGRLALDITALITNSAAAGALDRARRAGVAAQPVVWDRTSETRATFDARVLDAVAATEPDLVLLLGWMHLLAPAFIDRFGELLNVHPAFLPFDTRADDVTMPDGSRIPAFRGAHGIRDALAAGVAWSGATVHRVTRETDRGAILVRTPFSLAGIGDERALTERLRPIEHAAVAAAIRRWTFERSAL